MRRAPSFLRARRHSSTAGAASGTSGVADDESWERVDLQARKLSTLVRDLRKLAELETRPLERERVDLEAVLREAIDAVGQQHPDAASRLNLAVTRVPWPVPQVEADLDLLAVAIDNVLANAANSRPVGRSRCGYARKTAGR